MADPLPPLPEPVRKDPQKKTRTALIPPLARSRLGMRLGVQAARGRFHLPHCDSCAVIVWPPREACPSCLSDLQWRAADPHGKLIAETTLETSPELYFRERVPWRVGTVTLAGGVPVMAHLHAHCRVGGRAEMADGAGARATPRQERVQRCLSFITTIYLIRFRICGPEL